MPGAGAALALCACRAVALLRLLLAMGIRTGYRDIQGALFFSWVCLRARV